MTHRYEVGQPYNPGVRRWPEAAQYNYRGGTHDLAIFLDRPSRHEVEAVKAGESEFALFVDAPLIVLCYRFEARGRGIPWSDAPFSWHRLRDARPREAILPPAWEEGSPEVRATLVTTLVDASDGIVRALRAVSLSPGFTAAIHRAIWDQAHAPWDPAAYDAGLAALYRTYASTEALVGACKVRTKGGA